MRCLSWTLRLVIISFVLPGSPSLQAQSSAPAQPREATSTPATAGYPNAMVSARSVRHLLRNGMDYITFGEFERALTLLREAASRQNELNPQEREQLHLALRQAHIGLIQAKAQHTASRNIPSSSRAMKVAQRSAGTVPTYPPIPDLPIEPIQLVGVSPSDVQRTPSHASASPEALPPLPAQRPPTATTPQGAPVAARVTQTPPAVLAPTAPVPAALPEGVEETANRPENPPETLSTGPNNSDTPTAKSVLVNEPSELTQIPPTTAPPQADETTVSFERPELIEADIPVIIPTPVGDTPAVGVAPADLAFAPEPIAPAVAQASADASVQAAQDVALPASPQPPLVEPAPPPLGSSQPLQGNVPIPDELSALPPHSGDSPAIPAMVTEEPNGSPLSVPEPPPSVQPESQALRAQVDEGQGEELPGALPQLPPSGPSVSPSAPQAAVSPDIFIAPAPLPPPAENVIGGEHAPADFPALPLLPAASFRTDSGVPSGAASMRQGSLPENLEREVETIARRQTEYLSTERAQTSPRGTPVSSADTMSDLGEVETRIKLPRPPSPTQPRPIRAVPVPEDFTALSPRQWGPTRKVWAAPATCHGPLYFQDPVLERYGQSIEQGFGKHGRFLTYPLDDPRESKQRNQILQPFVSAGIFASQIAIWPYNILVNPPWEAEYDLGYYRPGDRIPPDTYYFPLHGYGPPLQGKKY